MSQICGGERRKKRSSTWENQLRRAPPPDETLTKSAVAADAKAVGDALGNKADKNNSVYCNDRGGTKSYMISIPNIGHTQKTVDIVLQNVEQFVFIIAGSSLGNNFVSVIGGSNFVNTHLGKTLTTSTDGNIIHVTLPSWFRGTMISYYPFSISGL